MADVGAWLSLVEHSVRDRGVGGSNPLAPTNFLIFLRKSAQFSLAGHSVFLPNSVFETEWPVLQIHPSVEIVRDFPPPSLATGPYSELFKANRYP
jgi:hypothetical protein